MRELPPGGTIALLLEAADASGAEHSREDVDLELVLDLLRRANGYTERERQYRLGLLRGYLKLGGTTREHVLELYEKVPGTYIHPETLTEILSSRHLSDRDVVLLTLKLWSERPRDHGSIIPVARKSFQEHERTAARAAGVVAEAWYASYREFQEAVLLLVRAGREAVDIYETLAADRVRERRLSRIDPSTAHELIEQATLLARESSGSRE